MEPVAQYFVGTRSLVGFRLAETNDGYVIDQYAKLVEVLTKRAGAQVAGLFAEPHISYGNGKAPARVDWYTRYDGIARPLVELDPSSALAVQRVLTTRLAALRPLSFDPEYGPLVAAALNIADPNGIVSVGGEPVLVDWGMLPQASQGGDRQRAQHFSSTLAPYLPDFGLPPASQTEWARNFASSESQGQHGPGQQTASSTSANAPGIIPVPATGRRGPSLTAPVIATSLAALLLGILYIPGVLAFPSDSSPASEAAIATARQVVSSLENQRRKLDDALLAPCPALINTNTTAPVVPPSLDNVRVTVPPAPSAPGAPPAPATPPSAFSSRVNAGTVLVITPDASGSGFFVAPDLLVTNRHVVENNRKVRVANSVIGIIEADVVRTGDGDLQDFAVLKVAPQAAAKPFEIANIPPVLQQVVAVGYPGVAMRTDQTYRRLMQGDAAAARDLSAVMTVGPVNHVQQQSAAGVTLVVHGAEISHGNSGGPLVDLCGRVVGINTFGRNDDSVMWRYALGSDGIKAFIERAGGSPRVVTNECTPQVVAAAEPPAATATPATPPAPAPQPPAAATPAAAAPSPSR